MGHSVMKFSEEHEWVRLEPNGFAIVGISKFATDELGDIVFLELPDAGTKIVQFEKLGEIESVKAVSDLFAPISGLVIEHNEAVIENPNLVNDSPLDKGWLVKVELSNSSNLDNLMTPQQYEAFLKSQSN